MANSITPVQLPVTNDINELRRSVERELNVISVKLNSQDFRVDVNANNHRIRNLRRPVDANDAVTLGLLDTTVKKLEAKITQATKVKIRRLAVGTNDVVVSGILTFNPVAGSTFTETPTITNASDANGAKLEFDAKIAPTTNRTLDLGEVDQGFNDVFAQRIVLSTTTTTQIELSAGYAGGPALDLGDVVLQDTGSVTTRGMYVAGNKVVGRRQAAVTNPVGGTNVDDEARASIDEIIARLEAHGLIAT